MLITRAVFQLIGVNIEVKSIVKWLGAWTVNPDYQTILILFQTEYLYSNEQVTQCQFLFFIVGIINTIIKAILALPDKI